MLHKLNFHLRHQRARKGVAYKIAMGPRKLTLPAVVDLREPINGGQSFLSPVENQGTEGDCAAHAGVGALEFLQNKMLAQGGGSLVYGPNFERMCRQQIYWGARDIEGNTQTDSGIYNLDDIAITAQSVGVARESLWPYVAGDVLNPPKQEVLDDAAQHKLPLFYNLDFGYQLKHCLFSGYPFMFGFQVFEGFMSEEVADTGEMKMPGPNEQIVGGHAVLAVGYDDARQCFIVRNSWGAGWGIDGYFHMPYEFVDSQYCGNFVTLREVESRNP